MHKKLALLFLLIVVPAFAAPDTVFCAAGKPAAPAQHGKPSPAKPPASSPPVAAPARAPAAAPQTHPHAGAGPAGTSATDASPGQVNARSAVLVDVATGTYLYEQNADEIIEPASFTKVLTLYLVFEAVRQGNLHLTDEIFVSQNAWRTGGSKMFVGVGSRVPLEELLKGIAVVSGNDACVAVAEHLYGSTEAFVEAMNRKAAELGMSKSHFMNPHGLPAEGQITTARDMATLGVAYIRRFPECLKYHGIREYTYNNINQYNRNRLLLKDPSVDGLKTGFVAAAGYHLAATAQREGMRLLSVVMGAATPAVRERESLKLLNYGYRFYTLVQPFPQGQPITTLKVWKGMKDELSLYPADAPCFLIPQTQKKSLKWEVHVPEEIEAPIASGQQFGEVVFYVGDQPKRNVALISQEEVPQGGWFKRFYQTFLHAPKINWGWVLGILGGMVAAVALFFFIANRKSARRSRSSLSG